MTCFGNEFMQRKECTTCQRKAECVNESLQRDMKH